LPFQPTLFQYFVILISFFIRDGHAAAAMSADIIDEPPRLESHLLPMPSDIYFHFSRER